MHSWRAPSFLLTFALLAGCSPQPSDAPPPSPTSVTAPAPAPYSPAFASAAEAAKAGDEGTPASAFAKAAAAPTLNEATESWKAFLLRYPPDAESEDAAQKRYSDAARWELMRVHYLSGRVAEGDALLEAADPLGLR